MYKMFAGFIPFIDEAAWFANAIEQAARPAVSDGIDSHDCCGCWGVFTEQELCPMSGYCGACDAKLDAAIVIYGERE